MLRTGPDGHPDTTLLVGRVTDAGAWVLATILDYACHRTTLGPLNRQHSPDFVGAAREVVEAATGGAPCLFLQGASGELGPREGFPETWRSPTAMDAPWGPGWPRPPTCCPRRPARLPRPAGGRRAAALASLPRDSAVVTARIWRIGDALLVAQPDEAYPVFQRGLRAAVPGRPVLASTRSGRRPSIAAG